MAIRLGFTRDAFPNEEICIVGIEPLAHYRVTGEECVCCAYALEEEIARERWYAGEGCNESQCEAGQCGICEHGFYPCEACAAGIDH